MRNFLRRRLGRKINRKCVQQLMRIMGIEAIYPKPKTSRPHPAHKVYSYLLRNITIDRPNQVWAADITYIPMSRGFMYLVAIMDCHSRKVLSFRLPIRWMLIFALRRLKRRCIGMVRLRSSIHIREPNLAVRSLPTPLKAMASPSAWAAKAASRTIFSLSVSGGR